MMTFEAIYDPEAGDSQADMDNAIDLTGKIGLVVDDAVGFDFKDAPAGKSLFLLGVQTGSLTASTGDPDDGGSNDLRGLLVTGQTAVVQINTSKASDTTIGYGNQGINPDEVVVFTYVKGNLDPDYVIPNLTQTTADLAANIEFDMYDPATQGQFDIAQTVSGATQALLLRAYDIDSGVEDFEFFNASNGFMANRSEVDFLTVSVDLMDGGVVNFNVSTATLNAPVTVGRITFTLTSDGVKVSGLLAGDTVLFTTDGLHDQVEIEGFSGNFDVGGYKTTTTNELATDIGGQFNIEDAGISVSVSTTSATLSGLEVDETIGTDRAASGETANGNTDDEAGKLGVVTSNEKIGTLFSDSVTPDTDGHDSSADIDLYKLVLVDTSGAEPDATATTLATTLSVSAGATGYVAGTAAITLVLSGGVVYGMYNGDTDPTDGSANIAFKVELTAANENGQVKVTLYEPIAHSATSTHDEVIDLVTSNGYLGIQHDLVVYDYDDDFASSSAIKDITPFIDFGDDGPTASVLASGAAVSSFALNLDETGGNTDRYGAGDAVQDNDSGADEVTLTAIGGITPFGQKTTAVSGGLKTLFTVSTDAGQDDPGTTSYKFEFVLNDGDADGVATTLKTSVGGETIKLKLQDLNADGVTELVGYEAVSGAVAFVVSIENATSDTNAQLTFRQVLAFENPTSPSTYDELASILTAQSNDSVGIKLTVTQTDSEGDSEAANYTRTIIDDTNTLFTSDDDGPDIGGNDNDIDDADIKFASSGVNSSATVDLEASMGRDFDGASGGVTITDFEPTLVYSYPNFSLTLTGDYTDDSMKEVVYYIEDGTAGYDGTETVYFRMKLDDSNADPANWTYTWSSEQDPPEPNLEFDFDGFPSGQQIYGVFAPNSVTPNGDALLVVPDGIVLKANGTRDSAASTSLNSSNAEASGTALGISGQSVDNGETMYFFSIEDPSDTITVGATGFDKTSYKNGNTLDFDGFIDRTSAQIEIAQTTPNGSEVDMTITAYNMTSNDTPASSEAFLQDPLAAAHTTVQITSVRIYDGEPMEDDSNLVATATISGDGSTDSFVIEAAYVGIYTGTVIDNGDKTVEVTDVLDDYTVEIGTASGADTFAVTNTDDEGDSFDIGGVNFLEAQFTPDKQLDWEITITDFDGDTDSVQITTGIDGTDPADTLVVI